MRPFLCFSLLFSACLWADQAADRVAIGKVMSTLNEGRDDPRAKPLSSLFISGADPAELDRLSHLERRIHEISSSPWSEVSTPRIVVNSIRFVTSDVARVDAVIAKIGSLSWSHENVLFVMKKQGARWRIVSLRVGYR
jgi:hypothetical protein